MVCFSGDKPTRRLFASEDEDAGKGGLGMMVVDTAAVRAAMLEQGIGTMELVARSGLPSKTASNFVTGDRKARVATITKLARGLNVAPMTLVKREDNDGD